jgi:hypothetical protein
MLEDIIPLAVEIKCQVFVLTVEVWLEWVERLRVGWTGVFFVARPSSLGLMGRGLVRLGGSSCLHDGVHFLL